MTRHDGRYCPLSGQIFLTEDVAAYTVRTGRIGYTKAIQLGAIDFTGATTNVQIVRFKEMRATDLETFNMQEDACSGLSKLIIANVPAKILMELENADSGLDEVEPRRFLATIKKLAAPITVLDAMTLRLACNAPLTFDTADTPRHAIHPRQESKGGPRMRPHNHHQRV